MKAILFLHRSSGSLGFSDAWPHPAHTALKQKKNKQIRKIEDNGSQWYSFPLPRTVKSAVLTYVMVFIKKVLLLFFNPFTPESDQNFPCSLTRNVTSHSRARLKKNFSACPYGKLQLRSTCPEFILTCPDFFLLCAIFPLLWTTKGKCLLIRSKYRSVKSPNVYSFRVLGSVLLAWQASCQGDLLALHKNSLAPGKRTRVLSCRAQYGALGSLLRWKTIALPVLTTSPMHFSMHFLSLEGEG